MASLVINCFFFLFKHQFLKANKPTSVQYTSMWTEKEILSLFFCLFLRNQRSGLTVTLTHRVELPKSSEAWTPFSEIVIVLVRV